MKKIITGMALLLVTTLSAFSQTKNITVSGRVVEDTKEPAIQATVQLLLLPDSVQASGTATTAQGYFTLPKVSAGKYVLKVSYIGFKSQYIPLHLYATTTAKNVGTLTLETAAPLDAQTTVAAHEVDEQSVGGHVGGKLFIVQCKCYLHGVLLSLPDDRRRVSSARRPDGGGIRRRREDCFRS